MNILQILPALGPGGVERGAFEFAKFLKEKDYGSFVASQGGPLARELEEAGVRHFLLPLKHKNPFHILINAYRLWRIVRDNNIDILHARSRGPAWSAFLVARLAGKPFITTFHGTYNFKNNLKRFYNSIMVRGDRVIAISPYIYNHIVASYGAIIKAENICLINRGVDLTVFNPTVVSSERVKKCAQVLGKENASPVLLVPGRLTRWKGQKIVLEALKKIIPVYPNLLCLFVGPDQGRRSYKEELINVGVQKGLSSYIKFIQSFDDMPAAYKLSDVVIHASTDPEAFGRVIIEAQAMEAPVIASRLGAPQEIIQEGETGWLHEPGNAEDLAQILLKVLALSREDRQRVVQRALNRVQEFYDTLGMFEKTLNVYHEVL